MPYPILSIIAALAISAPGAEAPQLTAKEVPSVAGWQVAQPTPGTHRVTTDLASPRTGKGCVKIVGSASEGGARGAVTQEFYRKNALKPGRTYRYEVSYRTEGAFKGSGLVLIDSYAAEGEKSRRELVAKRLPAAEQWQTLSGEITVPEKAARVRMLLYLRGEGTLFFDDAFFGEVGAAVKGKEQRQAGGDQEQRQASGLPHGERQAGGLPHNLLQNGGFEPPGSYVYDLAPEKPSGNVRFAADFDNAALGKVKQLGASEFYAYAFPEDKPRSSFLWFHFRVDNCKDRELTFHINPAPFSREKTGGNGTRSPVVSYDGDRWAGIETKSWNDDGTVLTFTHRFTRSPAWIASFFPYTAEHIARFAAEHRQNPFFKAAVLGKTLQGRPQPYWTITDPAVPEKQKRVILFTCLQHDLETTGAMAIEGICRFLLSKEPRAEAMRRGFVFYAVPMMDPDGIAGGNLYCPAGNMNRQWGLGTAPETTNVEQFATRLKQAGRPIDLFMDFHGWCTPERTTVFMTFGKEIADPQTEQDAVRLAETIKPRLSGKTPIHVWRKMTEHVTMGPTDLRRLSCGWMKYEGGARLAYSIEIFGEGACTQEQYEEWGKAFAEGIGEFYSR